MPNIALARTQSEYIASLAEHCDYGLTLQTNLHTCNAGYRAMQRKVDTAKQAFRTFLPKLNRLLSGNGWMRKAEHLPLIITALEGSLNTYDKNNTLHFHLCIGNVDKRRLDVDFLEKLIGHWEATGVGTDDVKLHPLYLSRAGFGSYCSKEVWQRNEDYIAFDLTQIPAHITGI